MCPQKRNTDPAALSIAVAAGAISVSLAPGPYGIFSLVVGLTLLTVIYAYEWEYDRTDSQSLGLALTMGFTSLLVLCFAYDLCYSIGVRAGFQEPIPPNESAMTEMVQFNLWVLASTLLFLLDTNKRKAGKPWLYVRLIK